MDHGELLANCDDFQWTYDVKTKMMVRIQGRMIPATFRLVNDFY